MPTRIEKLASNSIMYYRSDMCLEISPFTNYYIFTIYKESSNTSINEHVPLNLTNLGTIWLSFISGSTRVRISHYKDAENVDMANGEVVFRISEQDANKILSLNNNTFYISSSITDGVSTSDETVLFSGQWSEYSQVMRSSLTETIDSLNESVKQLTEQRNNDLSVYESEINKRIKEIEVLKNENDNLRSTINDLEEKLNNINSSYINANIIKDKNVNNIPLDSSKKVNNQMDYNLKRLEKSILLSYRK